MLSAALSLGYLAGDSIELDFAVTDEAGEVANLTGDTVQFAIANRAGDVILGTEDGSATVTITDAPGGLFSISVAPQLTVDLLGTYRFQVRLVDVSGNAATVAFGFLSFKKNLLS
jgi:hypothetical protein